MTIGEKIKQLRESHPRKDGGTGLSQTELGKLVGVTRNMVWAWENGKGNVTPDRMKKLAAVFGKPLEFFKEASSVGFGHVARHGGAGLQATDAVDSEYVKLPIMGILPAGSPDDATASYRGNWEVRRQILKGRAADHIVVEARGDSMINLGIHDGDMLTVRLQPDADDGQIVAAYIEGDGVTCKTLRKKNGKPCLETANPDRKAPLGPFKIMGVVIWREGKPW